MKILHIIPQFPYFSETSIVGGAANTLFNLAKEQAKYHHVTIAAYMPGRAREFKTASNINLIPLEVRGAPGSTKFGLHSILMTVFWIIKNKKSFDLIHGHSGFLDYVLTTWLGQKISRKPAIHSLYCPVPANSGRWNKSSYRHALIKSVQDLECFTALSQNVRQSLFRYGVVLDSCPVILPSIDNRLFYPDGNSSNLRATLGILPDDFVILFVGNSKPAKNLITVLHSLHKVRQLLPKAKLIITTELQDTSHNERVRAIAGLIKELDLESAIVQLGIVDNMPELMRASDVLIAPFIDTFGPSDYFIAPLEAMACGKPVIVSPVGGMPEIISNAVGILVNPHNAVEITDAIYDLAINPAKRSEMGTNAANFAEKMFAPAKANQQFYDIYRSIL